MVATPKESTSVALFVEGKEHAAPLPLVACGEAPAYDCTALDSSLADGKLPCVAQCLWLLSALLIAVLGAEGQALVVAPAASPLSCRLVAQSCLLSPLILNKRGESLSKEE